MNRFCLLLLLFLAGCTQLVQPPNIIFILADDLGYGDLGCYGQEKIETPNIDDLARQGMRFTQHYAGSPVCAPSRCVLMTGKHTGHAFIRGNHEWGERGEVWNYQKAVDDPNLEGQYPIPENTVTVARLLQDAGYKTALVGKWGLGGPLTHAIPTKQGFDFFFGYNCQRQAHTYYPKHLWKNEEKVWLNNELYVPGTPLPEGANPDDPQSYAHFSQPDYSPDVMFDEILNFVENNRDEPFFLYWATPIPHVPLQAPQAWVDYYVAKFGDEEPYLGQQGYCPSRYPHATFAAMVSYLDEQVGLLIKKLKELDLYENTLIIFTSDNGAGIGGGSDAEWFDSAKPFISQQGRIKGTVYEGGIRVPMIASWPGTIKAGSQTDHLSVFYDVLPTLCHLTGVDAPDDIDGISFLPRLLRKSQKQHDYLYWEFPAYGGQQAVRMGDWKAIRRDILSGNTEIELFNLAEDIQEQTNVAAEHPEILQKMEEILRQEHEPSSIERFHMPALGDR
ncbi:N-acetylgalactosamine-6-sulfatase [candidate division KSB1 bacterium]|nr:arylsulfatase [candidate division KSB1 bacterium]RQW06884.1 MAG: N-acetylgalactosamine-6-sulfatase [candidate division KSB1 bacterium]